MNKRILLLGEDNCKILAENIQKFSKNDIYYSSYTSLTFKVQKGEVEIFDEANSMPLNDYDLVYFREGNSLASACKVFLESKNIAFLNKDLATKFNFNKLSQYVKLALGGYPVPLSFYSSHENLLKHAKEMAFPFILKSISASLGKDNFLIKNYNELVEILSANSSIPFIMQEYIPNSFDYRVVVLGDKVGTVLKRIRQNENDHRNNTALGAREEEILNLDEQMINTSIDISKYLNKVIAGIDLVKNEATGEYYILEINSKPVFTYDTSISSEVPKFTEYIDSVVA